MTGGGQDHRVFRPGGVSDLHIPAPDPTRSATFYRAAFPWCIRDDEDSPAFADGTGHVIGHFIRGLPVAGHAGHVPDVYADSVDETLTRSRPTAARSSALRSQRATVGRDSRGSRREPAWHLAAGTPPQMMSSWRPERGYLLTAIDEPRCRDGRGRFGRESVDKCFRPCFPHLDRAWA